MSDLLDGTNLPQAMAEMLDYLCGCLGNGDTRKGSRSYDWHRNVHEFDYICPQVEHGEREPGEPCNCDGYLVELIVPALVKLARGQNISDLEQQALAGWNWNHQHEQSQTQTAPSH